MPKESKSKTALQAGLHSKTGWCARDHPVRLLNRSQSFGLDVPYSAFAKAQPFGAPMPAAWLYSLELHEYAPLLPDVHGV